MMFSMMGMKKRQQEANIEKRFKEDWSECEQQAAKAACEKFI